MTKQEQVKKLYQQYKEFFVIDFQFEEFFDPDNTKNLDKKIDLLSKAIEQDRLFISFDDAYDLLDNYPADIEDEGGHWTVLP